MTKTYILNFLKTHKSDLKERFGLIRIGLFGSYTNDTADKNSDIDFVIETETKDFFIREDIFKIPVDIGYLDKFREFYKNKIKKEIIYV